MAAAAELVARCFAARTAAHFAHLTTKSYAHHMALESFYEDIVPATDQYVECYMGACGRIASFPDIPPLDARPIVMLSKLRDWIVEERGDCGLESPELANLVDNILAVVDRALYKLENLS